MTRKNTSKKGLIGEALELLDVTYLLFLYFFLFTSFWDNKTYIIIIIAYKVTLHLFVYLLKLCEDDDKSARVRYYIKFIMKLLL